MNPLTFVDMDYTAVDIFLSPNIAIELKSFEAAQSLALDSPFLRNYYQELGFTINLLTGVDVRPGFDDDSTNPFYVFGSNILNQIFFFDNSFDGKPIRNQWEKLAEQLNSFSSNFDQKDYQFQLQYKYSPLLKQVADLNERIKKFLALVKNISVATQRLLHIAFYIYNKISRSPTLQKKEPPVGGVKIGGKHSSSARLPRILYAEPILD